MLIFVASEAVLIFPASEPGFPIRENIRTAGAEGRCGIAQEALDLESAWQKAGPEWAPIEANTLASFQALDPNYLLSCGCG